MIFNVNSGKGQDENLLPENIKNGVVIDDIVGTYSGEVFSAIMSFSNATSITIPHTMGRTPTSILIVKQNNAKGTDVLYCVAYYPVFSDAVGLYSAGASSSGVTNTYFYTQSNPITMSSTSVTMNFAGLDKQFNGTYDIILL